MAFNYQHALYHVGVRVPKLEAAMVRRVLESVAPLAEARKLGALLLQLSPSGVDALCAEVLLRDGSVWIIGDAEVARPLGPAGVAGLTRFS